MLHKHPNENVNAPKAPTPPDERLLAKTYLDVLAFEKKVRSSFGAKFATLISDEKRDEFFSESTKFIGNQLIGALVGDAPTDTELAYVRLINAVLTEVGHAFPVKELHVLWPSTGATKEEAAFLTEQGCDCLAGIAGEASRRLLRPRALSPNKFKL